MTRQSHTSNAPAPVGTHETAPPSMRWWMRLLDVLGVSALLGGALVAIKLVSH